MEVERSVEEMVPRVDREWTWLSLKQPASTTTSSSSWGEKWERGLMEEGERSNTDTPPFFNTTANIPSNTWSLRWIIEMNWENNWENNWWKPPIPQSHPRPNLIRSSEQQMGDYNEIHVKKRGNINHYFSKDPSSSYKKTVCFPQNPKM